MARITSKGYNTHSTTTGVPHTQRKLNAMMKDITMLAEKYNRVMALVSEHRIDKNHATRILNLEEAVSNMKIQIDDLKAMLDPDEIYDINRTVLEMREELKKANKNVQASIDTIVAFSDVEFDEEEKEFFREFAEEKTPPPPDHSPPPVAIENVSEVSPLPTTTQAPEIHNFDPDEDESESDDDVLVINTKAEEDVVADTDIDDESEFSDCESVCTLQLNHMDCDELNMIECDKSCLKKKAKVLKKEEKKRKKEEKKLAKKKEKELKKMQKKLKDDPKYNEVLLKVTEIYKEKTSKE